MASVRTRDVIEKQWAVGKNASFKMTENVCSRKNLFTLFYPPTTKFSIVILLFCNPSSRRQST